MAPSDDEKLGRQLLRTLKDVNELIPRAKPEDLEKLTNMRKKLVDQIGGLVDRNIDSANEAYRDATSGLVAASGSIQAAINGVESVANAVETLSKAVDLVARLMVA